MTSIFDANRDFMLIVTARANMMKERLVDADVSGVEFNLKMSGLRSDSISCYIRSLQMCEILNNIEIEIFVVKADLDFKKKSRRFLKHKLLLMRIAAKVRLEDKQNVFLQR